MSLWYWSRALSGTKLLHIAIVEQNIRKVGLSGQPHLSQLVLIEEGVHASSGKTRPRSSMHKPKIFIALLLFGCSAQRSSQLYAGDLEPSSGTCDPPAQTQLVIRGNTVAFSPNSGTVVLAGKVAGDGINAVRTLVGADRKPYSLQFKGVLAGSEIHGTYETTRCRYRVSLRAVAF